LGGAVGVGIAARCTAAASLGDERREIDRIVQEGGRSLAVPRRYDRVLVQANAFPERSFTGAFSRA